MSIETIFADLLDNKLGHEEISKFLTDLAQRGETVEDIAHAARALRMRMSCIKAPSHAIDIVGTGGDGRNTLNISTATAIVVAACNVPVAKHGNRAVSSRSGSSDVLSALGVNLDASPAIVERIMEDTGLAFLMAPLYHPSMQIVAPVRKALGQRTIFNLLGPLINPANVHRHLIGVYDRKSLRPFAEVLHSLDSRFAWIVHSEDGTDELTPTSLNYIVQLKNGKISEFTLDPKEYGLSATMAELQGGDAAYNAYALCQVLDGIRNAYRSAVLLNAAAALVVAEKTDDIGSGLDLAAQAIDNGAAQTKLNEFVKATNDYV